VPDVWTTSPNGWVDVPHAPLGAAPVHVRLLTLGCARNEVDSSEIAGRLSAGGFAVDTDDDTDDEFGGDRAARPDVVVVNTCAFVADAKKDSIDTLLAAADTGAKVVAVGCLAERYGRELAEALPEADAVLGFDAYPELATLFDDVVHGVRPASHTPVDRRRMLPVTPVDRAAAGVVVPGHATGGGTGPRWIRTPPRRGPVAPLKIASGCDRRCTFCAIPSFRGSFVSRPIAEIVDEAAWLADHGVRELYLVSENTTSYGKDLRIDRPLDRLLAALAVVPGVRRIRLSYLQPAEIRPWLIDAIAENPAVADYFDISFQHAAGGVLRRMRRFGDRSAFLALLDQVRAAAPEAGVRSNVIVGFPGETDDDVVELERFLTQARLDAVGVFGYSDEDGTAAAELDGKLPEGVIAERVERITALVEELTAQRAEDRVGTVLDVLVDEPADRVPDEPPTGAWGHAAAVGRGAHQAPDVDGVTTIVTGIDSLSGTVIHPAAPDVGSVLPCRVIASSGVDLVAEPLMAGMGYR
jgi:ribosomal protein S12 methylthiotransferase